MPDLLPQTPYTFTAYAECTDFARHENVNNNAETIEANVRDALTRRAGLSIESFRIDVTRNRMTADVGCVVVTCTTGDRILPQVQLDNLVLGAFNKGAEAAGQFMLADDLLFHRHQAGVWAMIANDSILRTLSGRDPSNPEAIGVVATDVTRGHDVRRRPSASDSVIGRATSQLNTVRSTDPERDSNARLTNNVSEAAHDAKDAWDSATWVKVAVVSGVALAAAIGIAYVVRSVR